MNGFVTSERGGAASSFWKRPEGKVGAVVALTLGGAGVFLLYRLLPHLIMVAGDLLHLALLSGGLFAVLYLAMSRQFRTLLAFLFQSAMWRLTNLFVDLDPVAIVKGYLHTLDHYIRDMSQQMALLNGHIQKLSQKMEKYARERETRLLNVQAAARNMESYKSAAIVNGNQAERLEKAYQELAALRNKLQNAFAILDRVREIAQTKYEDMTNAVNVEIDKRDAYRAVGGVLTAAMKILKGGEGKELYDAAMEKMLHDYSMEMGRLESFLAETRSMFTTFDLEDEASALRTIATIERWEKETAGKTVVIAREGSAVQGSAAGCGNSLDSIMKRRI